MNRQRKEFFIFFSSIFNIIVNMRVLVVEDERHLSAIIRRGLTEEGFAVDVAYDGEEAAYMAENTPFDVVILDIMLPHRDGLAVTQELRRKHINTPILMLTARDSIDDRVKGLDSGADDYLVKPFAFNELLARLRALMRRDAVVKTRQLVAGDLSLDTATREVMRGTRRIELTAKDYAILEYFMRHPGTVVTRSMLKESIWNYEYEGASNIIDVYIRRLRRKLDDRDESLIMTVRGAGYRLCVP
jgi:DNA-binding response OmpR family regulator